MRHSLYTILFLACWGCGEALIEPPENLIPEEQMSEILYDIAIVESINSSYPGVLKRNGIQVMPFIYEKYGIDSLQFTQSDLYYASRPVLYQKIYETVEARLIQEKDSITKIIQGANDPEKEGEESPE